MIVIFRYSFVFALPRLAKFVVQCNSSVVVIDSLCIVAFIDYCEFVFGPYWF